MVRARPEEQLSYKYKENRVRVCVQAGTPTFTYQGPGSRVHTLIRQSECEIGCICAWIKRVEKTERGTR